MTPDETAKLLTELVAIYDAYHGNTALIFNQGQGMDGYSALQNYDDFAKKVVEMLEK